MRQKCSGWVEQELHVWDRRGGFGHSSKRTKDAFAHNSWKKIGVKEAHSNLSGTQNSVAVGHISHISYFNSI